MSFLALFHFFPLHLSYDSKIGIIPLTCFTLGISNWQRTASCNISPTLKSFSGFIKSGGRHHLFKKSTHETVASWPLLHPFLSQSPPLPFNQVLVNINSLDLPCPWGWYTIGYTNPIQSAQFSVSQHIRKFLPITCFLCVSVLFVIHLFPGCLMPRTLGQCKQSWEYHGEHLISWSHRFCPKMTLHS